MQVISKQQTYCKGFYYSVKWRASLTDSFALPSVAEAREYLSSAHGNPPSILEVSTIDITNFCNKP